MASDISGPAVRLACRALAPLSRSATLAAATEVGIWWEDCYRRLLDAQVLAPAARLGIQTPAQRRRQLELEAAANLREDSGHSHQGALGSTPVVNWHEGGSGEALVLLNGWTASGLSWPAGWVRQLETRFRVIRVDNRGTGWSRTAPTPFSIAAMADDARDVMDACGIRQALVVGTSMGGAIAQELAIRHPSYVDRLVLLATRPPTPSHITPDYSILLSMFGRPRPGQDLREYFAHLWGRFAADGFADNHPEVMDEMVAQILARLTPRTMIVRQARAFGAWHGPRRLTRIDVPTTVIHGELDPLVPASNGQWLARLIPGAKYVELPGVGHLVAQEAGDHLISLLAPHALPREL